MDGTSGTKTLTRGAQAFNNLTFNDGGGTATFELQDALDVDGNLTITGGTLDTKLGNNYAINVGGNWTNADTFTPRSGTVIFDGAAAQSVTSGASAYNTLTSTNASASGVTFTDAFTAANVTDTTAGSRLTFNAGSTYTITGTLTVLGTLINNVQLLSSSAGSRFTLDVTGSAQTVDYVSVKDSNASTNNITARNSFDLGNTDGPMAAPHWIFINPINSVLFGTDF